ncbi:M48 family metalloprotease [Halomonas campisalis]|uniref:M48 family metalloprotease n=1 Tax=Billgrantia campisalis TaxID=74661 RepID=A0ABS9PBS7_9GAMM|nr:M48 family metalloprotease [Halomonas campisalis]
MQPYRLWRSRLKNGLQTLLILLGLSLVLSVPGYLLAGVGGVLICLAAVLMAVYLSSWVPARLILASSGAGLLQRHQAPELYRVLDALYRRAGLSLPPRLYYAPSPDLNAFAVGDRRDGGIALTEGLLRTLSLRQLAGVLAHEVSHLRHNDTRVMSMAAAMSRLTLWVATLVQVVLIMMVPMMIRGDIGIPWLALLVVALSPTVSSLLQLALSRNREYTADLDAVALTGDPRGLASALEVLERFHGAWLESLFGRHPPAWLDWLRTHPPTRERIRRLLALGEDTADDGRPPLFRHTDTGSPVITERPGPLGRRYWIVRRR